MADSAKKPILNAQLTGVNGIQLKPALFLIYFFP